MSDVANAEIGHDPDIEECPECGWLYGGHHHGCEIYAAMAQDAEAGE